MKIILIFFLHQKPYKLCPNPLSIRGVKSWSKTHLILERNRQILLYCFMNSHTKINTYIALSLSLSPPLSLSLSLSLSFFSLILVIHADSRYRFSTIALSSTLPASENKHCRHEATGQGRTKQALSSGSRAGSRVKHDPGPVES